MAIAPWINIQPSDYLAAADAGSKTGIGLANIYLKNQAMDERDQEASASEQQRQAQLAQQNQLRQQQLNAALQQKRFQDQLMQGNQNIAVSKLADTVQNQLAQLGVKQDTLGLDADKIGQPKVVRGSDGTIYSFDANGNLQPLTAPDTSKQDMLDQKLGSAADIDRANNLARIISANPTIDPEKLTSIYNQAVNIQPTATATTPPPAADSGSHWYNPFSWGSGGGNIQPQAATTTATNQPASQPSTSTGPQPAPVDKSQRVVGQSYILPNGQTGTWMGGGWAI